MRDPRSGIHDWGLPGPRIPDRAWVFSSRRVITSAHVTVGQASELDLKRAEVSLLERQLDMKRIQQELDALAGVKRQ